MYYFKFHYIYRARPSEQHRERKRKNTTRRRLQPTQVREPRMPSARARPLRLKPYTALECSSVHNDDPVSIDYNRSIKEGDERYTNKRFTRGLGSAATS